MEITPFKDVVERPRRVAVGEFDGVHCGHRRVIEGNDTVLTFEPHPATVLRPGRAPRLLTPLDVKAELIAELGVRELVVVPFDNEFATRSASQFIETTLTGRLGATHISVGENFRFGHGSRGGPGLLTDDPRFETRVVPLVEADGRSVSSTQIRELVSAGDVEHARDLLCAPFRLRGTIVGGDRRGRELGFPTANIAPDPGLMWPGHGVYACRAGEYLAAVSIGVRPTFGDGLVELVEAFLLDFDGDLYGQELTLDFFARLRGEDKFDGIEPLIAQMRRDVERTRELLASGAE